MKTYFSNIIPKIKQFSKKLDNLTLLTNQLWIVLDDTNDAKNVYIFRANNELLISQNGRVEKAKWEYLGHNSLLIDRKDESYLFKHGFFDENVLALKVDSKEEYAFLVNESKYNQELNSLNNVVDFLREIYLEPKTKGDIRSIDTQQSQRNDAIDIQFSNVERYVTPKFEFKQIQTKRSLFGNITEVFFIEFEDGITGSIHYEHRKQSYFFKGSDFPIAIRMKHHYEDFNSCVKALHCFLRSNSLIKEGFLFSVR